MQTEFEILRMRRIVLLEAREGQHLWRQFAVVHLQKSEDTVVENGDNTVDAPTVTDTELLLY